MSSQHTWDTEPVTFWPTLEAQTPSLSVERICFPCWPGTGLMFCPGHKYVWAVPVSSGKNDLLGNVCVTKALCCPWARSLRVHVCDWEPQSMNPNIVESTFNWDKVIGLWKLIEKGKPIWGLEYIFASCFYVLLFRGTNRNCINWAWRAVLLDEVLAVQAWRLYLQNPSKKSQWHQLAVPVLQRGRLACWWGWLPAELASSRPIRESLSKNNWWYLKNDIGCWSLDSTCMHTHTCNI